MDEHDGLACYTVEVIGYIELAYGNKQHVDVLLLNMGGNRCGGYIKKTDIVFPCILLIVILLADRERGIIEGKQTGCCIFLPDNLIVERLCKTGYTSNSSGSAVIHEG
jgi:hypothetical protein